MTLEKDINKMLLSDKRTCFKRIRIDGEDYCNDHEECKFYEGRAGINIKGNFYNGCFYWNDIENAIVEADKYEPCDNKKLN